MTEEELEREVLRVKVACPECGGFGFTVNRRGYTEPGCSTCFGNREVSIQPSHARAVLSRLKELKMLGPRIRHVERPPMVIEDC